MICLKCKNDINDNSLFCQWCGIKIEPLTTETMPKRIKQLKRSSDDDFQIARAVYNVWYNNLYFPKYSNLEEYGEKELGLKRAQTYNYRIIGEKFVDKNNKLLFDGEGEWHIGQLLELKALSLSEVNALINRGIIHSNMTNMQLRKAVRDAADEK